jgi:hypothetical protein
MTSARQRLRCSVVEMERVTAERIEHEQRREWTLQVVLEVAHHAVLAVAEAAGTRDVSDHVHRC